MRVISPGPGHSPDNVVVYFPSQGLLFGGCLVLAGDKVGYRGDANMLAWPRAIESLRGLGARMIIPGHGDRTDPGLVDYSLKLLGGGR